MIDDFVRDLQLLWKADSLIGRVWLNVMARRFGLFVFAGLIGVFGLGMANAAGFYALQAPLGPVWAAASVAAADFVLAAIVLVMGRSAAPGPEMELALDVRKMALDSLRADVRGVEETLDALGHEIRTTKDMVLGFVHNPLDAAAQKLLVPAIMAIVKGMRARKDHT